VFQLVLPLHECADPIAAESLHSIADSAVEPLQPIANFVADFDSAGIAPTETS
jgi:hypothetical protein